MTVTIDMGDNIESEIETVDVTRADRQAVREALGYFRKNGYEVSVEIRGTCSDDRGRRLDLDCLTVDEWRPCTDVETESLFGEGQEATLLVRSDRLGDGWIRVYPAPPNVPRSGRIFLVGTRLTRTR